jgi:hypothetical protein
LPNLVLQDELTSRLTFGYAPRRIASFRAGENQHPLAQNPRSRARYPACLLAVFVTGHMTAVAVESSSLEWKVGYVQQRAVMGVDPTTALEVRWMVDPNDKRWAKHGNQN